MSETVALATNAQSAPGPGTMLRMAREARGISIPEVAEALKMSPRQIEAIEGEDFSRLSGATFIRGFIRNYARLLRIDAAPVLATLAEHNPLPLAELNAPANAGVKMPTSGGRQGKGLFAATLLALAALGVALALYFDALDLASLLNRQAGPTAPSQANQPPVAQPLPRPVAVAPTAEGGVAPVGTRPADPPEQAPLTAGMRQLIFSFDGSSWVEVRDAAGRTLLSQMNAKGTTRLVEGQPPFQMVVGNASNVRLQYGDQVVDLRPHTRVEVARLTLD